MKQERIRLVKTTVLTALMITAVTLTFPIKHVHLDGKNAWVLVSRIYIHREDSDRVLLRNGKTAYLEEAGWKNIYGRVLASSTEGFM